MIKSVAELKEKRPYLVESFEKMTKEELLKQCYLECADALNMEKRVSVFMETCTNNLSKTTYTTEAIRDMVNDKQEYDINEFCEGLSSMPTFKDILQEINTRADNYKSK